MVKKLVYDPKLDKAMRYIFGKTLICRNLEIATSISKQYGLDCITIDGDQVIITLHCFLSDLKFYVALHKNCRNVYIQG